MLFIQICVGSSCFLKGSERIVKLFKAAIDEAGLQDSIVLSGSFCLGKCNREGVSVSVGDGTTEEIFTGVTPEGFREFWKTNVLSRLK